MAAARTRKRGAERVQQPVRSAAAWRPVKRTVVLPKSGETAHFRLPDTRSLIGTGTIKVPLPLLNIAANVKPDANGAVSEDRELSIDDRLNAFAGSYAIADDLVRAALIWPVVVADDETPDYEAGEVHLTDIHEEDREYLAALLQQEGVDMMPFRARGDVDVAAVPDGEDVADETE